jgi:clan AA aspartic protease (TIGR02281 family)
LIEKYTEQLNRDIQEQEQATPDADTQVEKVVEVPFTKENGVTKVKCAINDLPLHFVFDTGAAEVTMSMVEANFMLKNDYITSNDIIGSARYVDANGDISEGTVVNLRKVNFGGLELDNVRASVVRNQKAPLLLGQSVLGRLGKIEIDNSAQTIKITSYKK